MYGIVNKAIEDLIKENFGEDKWNAVLSRSGVDVDFFVGNEPYDDDITYKIAAAASEETGLTLEEVLCAFGEWWVLRTGREKYGALMAAGGTSLQDFLKNLPVFHNRVMLMYPKLTPPEFKVSDLTTNSIHVHYFSKRQGLQPFVKGILQGLAKYYNVPTKIELIANRLDGDDHEVFRLTWQQS